MNIREASMVLEHTAGLGRLARRSGGGAAAVVLAGLAVYVHRRSGSTEVVVGQRAGASVTTIQVDVTPYQDFRAVTAQVGARLRQARPGAAQAGLPTAAQHADGWQIELPGTELLTFTTFFSDLVALPTAPIGRFDLASDIELEQLPQRVGTVRDRDPAETALTGFTRAVRRTPDAPALVYDTETVTYRELDARVNSLADWLIGRGVRPDTVVAVALPRSIDATVAVYAVLRAGGAFLPLDPGHPAERLDRILRIAQPLLVLSTRSAGFAGAAVPVCHVEDIDPAQPHTATAHPVNPRPEHLAYLMFTSGSTGMPKGVAVSHAAVVNHLHWMTAHLGLDHTDTVLQKTPVTFDVAIWELLWPLQIGARLAIAPPAADSDPAALSRLLAQHSVTTVQFVPSTLTSQLNVAPDFPACVRRVLLIGETLSPALARRFAAATPARLHNLYGPTEATGAVTGYPVSTRDSERIPIGAPGWNIGAYVLDSCLRPVPDDTPGELYLSGIQLARCYFGDPARTAERFVANPFELGGRLYRTGDIVRWNSGTGLLDYQGRADLQVKRHGVRIELGEIEAALSACAPVAQAAAVLRPEGRLIGYAIPVNGAICTEDALRKELSRTLPSALVPDEILVLDAFPHNAAGKLDRAALPAPAAPQAPFRAPRTEVEHTLAEVFAQVLGRDRVSVDDSFFALGGDSVMSILLVSRAKSRGIRFTAQQVFEERTVAGLAAIAGTGNQTPDVLAELPGGGVGELPPTPAVLALLELAEGGGAQFDRYAQHMILELPPGITELPLRTVLGAVLARHDMLRARLYRDASGGWRMFADPADSVDLDTVLTRLECTDDPAALGAAVGAAIGRLDPANGTVVQCVWLERGDRAGRLIVVVHHIAIDGVSWRILIPDLLAAWAQVSAGRRPELPGGGTSMRRWAHSLRAEAHRPERVAEVGRWQQFAGPDPLFTDRPLDPRIDTAATVRRIPVGLDEAATTAVLTTLPSLYRTDANTVLLTAVALAVAAWHRRRGLDHAATSIRLEGHGREPDLAPGADLSHTVGWFTAAFPCRLDLADLDADAVGTDLAAAVKTVKEQLLSVPGSGIGYGLLRYLNADTAPQLPAETTQLAFTYLGAFSGAPAAGGPWLPAADFASAETPQPLHDSGLPAGAAISIDALVADGRLTAGFAYPQTLLERDQVRELADLWLDALAALARHAEDPAAGGRTPSDFAVPLRQSDVDVWEKTYPGLHDIWSLTPIQEKFAALAPADPEALEAHTMQVILTCTGTPDRTRLHAAVQYLVDRHAALRAAFLRDASGSHWCQLITAGGPIPFREIDLRPDPSGLEDLLVAEQLRPFDLTAPPLIRFLLVRTADDRWMLALTNHRLLLDGWSAPILLRELLAVYALGIPEQTEIDDGFGTFLRWRAAQDRSSALAAWHAALHDLDGPTLVAAPGAVPSDPARSAAERRLTLSAAQTSGLSQLAAAAGVTLNTVFQYAWAHVLGAVTGRGDILFGTVVSGRPPALPGIASMVGSFINTVPVRVRLALDGDIDVRLRAVQAAQSAVVDHHYLGLDEVAAAAQLPVREFFDTALVFESYPVDGATIPVTLGELTLTELESREMTLFPLVVTVWPRDETQIALNWHRDLLDDNHMRQIIARLTELLDALSTRNGL
ncbi:non-ribosomal peptide synthetase [Nocardia sp. XZ_19_385]|uniref:non-ribosomal peptide synthetase n=1 Tax=Nocardia sp. XZ_19_385 TaxID=2769488 RepID=UPI00188EF7C7|nr:non-ribosomal peptide synthetase [Nocardia sp. XZ_19_385]